MDAAVEVTDHETSNAKTEAEAEKARLSSGKASVDVKHGPGEAQPAPPQQQGPLKRVLSRLPFFKGEAEYEQLDPPAQSNHKGLPSREESATLESVVLCGIPILTLLPALCGLSASGTLVGLTIVASLHHKLNAARAVMA